MTPPIDSPVPEISYSSNNLDHLGLVAAMVDELSIVETIDTVVTQDLEQRHVSVGTCVKAMVLNGLGYVNRALYLMPHFFQDKPIDRLLGPEITAEQLNDDVMGRALDKIYDYGIERLYTQVAATAIQHLGLLCETGHMDSTGFHTDGKYNSEDEPEEGVIHITKGYSRDHRPDLNQAVLQLVVENQAGVPILLKPLSGNNSDQTSFRETIENQIEWLKSDFGLKVIVADSALYNEKSLKALDQFLWISRVPETIATAKTLIDAVADDLMETKAEQAHCTLGVVYAEIKQRWLVVYSQAAEHRAQKTLARQHMKKTNADLETFAKLCKQAFACAEDAEAALIKFKKDLSLTIVIESHINKVPQYQRKGRPQKEKTPESYCFHIDGQLASLPEVHYKKLRQKSCFIIATNSLDQEHLDDLNIIEIYKKDQQKVERGFRFLKDPRFMASTLFLKSPKRIMALMMVMTLCLMVYAAIEWRIREALKKNKMTFPSQNGKSNNNPSARWVFQFFSGIHLLKVGQHVERILNINKNQKSILQLLGINYLEMYANSG